MGSRVLRREEARALFRGVDDELARIDARDVAAAIDPDALVDSPDVLVYDGDVDFDSLHLEPYTPSVVVRGNLRVRNVLRQDPGAGPLSVLGGLHARAIATEAELFASGDIIADELIYGRADESERGMKSLGRLQTPRLIADGGYLFAPAGGLDAGVFIDPEGAREGMRSYERALAGRVRVGRYFGAEVRGKTSFEGVAAVCAKLAAGEALLPDRWTLLPPAAVADPPPKAPAPRGLSPRAPKGVGKTPKAKAPAKKKKSTKTKTSTSTSAAVKTAAGSDADASSVVRKPRAKKKPKKKSPKKRAK